MGFLRMMVRGGEVDALVKEIAGLREDKKKLNDELETLKLKKRLEQEEITHMQRINEERMKIEVEQKKSELERKQAEQITAFKEKQRQELVASLKEFHGKLEERFNTELTNIKEMYRFIAERLPNVNYNIEKKITSRG